MSRGLAPLRHRGFRRLVAGQLTSGIGDACYLIALPWYVLAHHGGALLLGTVLAAYGVPRTAAIVFGGQASDRWRPWTVMMAADGVRVVAMAALAVAAAAGPARAAVLIPIAVVLGVGEGLFLPGSFSIIPTLLPDAELQPANALGEGATQLAALAGPALGGALVAFLGPAPAFALDAATFVVSVVSLAGVRAAQRAQPAGAPASVTETVIAESTTASSTQAGSTQAGSTQAGSTQAGSTPAETAPAAPGLWALIRSSRILAIMLLVSVAANLGSGGAFEVALPALAHGPLRAGAGGFGGLVAAVAVGSLLGTLAAGQLTGLRRPALVGSAVFLAGSVFLAVVPYAGGAVPGGVALALFGVTNGMGNVIMITVFQRWAPPALLGRLTSLLVLASFGIFPVSVLLGAVVTRDLGPALFFPIAAGALTVAILAGLSQREWRHLGDATDSVAPGEPALPGPRAGTPAGSPAGSPAGAGAGQAAEG
jgi:MFS family permease